MIKLISHENIDRAKWDHCIEHAYNSMIFAFSWYLDIVCENKWDALVLGDYESVFPLCYRKKYGIHYLHQPFFTNQLGVFSLHELNEKTASAFFKAIPEKYKYIEIGLNSSIPFQLPGFKTFQRRVQFVNLNSKEEHIKKLYSENLKRNIKKAEKAEYTIVENIEPEIIVKLFKLAQGTKLTEFKKKDYIILLQLMKACSKHNKGFGLGVNDPQSKSIVSAAYFMHNGKRITYLKGGSSEEGRENGAMHFLMNHVIMNNIEKSSILDFGGSSVTSVARFYNGYGASEYLFTHIKKNNLPLPLKWLKK